MISTNPFAEFQRECEIILINALKTLYPKEKVESVSIGKTSNPNFGQIASSVCFELAKKLSKKPADLAVELANIANKAKLELIERIVPVGGYVNFHVNYTKFTALTLESIKKMDQEYGLIKTDNPIKIIVEHTSVNPLHPIHIGQARNPMLGDSIARILKCRGNEVSRHYYIDDVGRQSSVIAYGYSKLGKPAPDEKADHFLGKIYTITACLVELKKLRSQLHLAKSVQTTEDISKITKELDEWTTIAAELEEKYSELFGILLRKIGEDSNPEEEINRLNRSYENGEAEAKKLIREVSNLCLEGFKETQERVKVNYDSWDWESDFVWTGQVEKVMRQLKESGYVLSEGGVLEFDAEKVIDTLKLRRKLNLREEQEVPPLTLVRADGTTLYTTRDVAYTVWKFSQAEKIINVIGMEQTLAQLQLKIALYALGLARNAEQFIHFAYNLVTLPSYKMSSRRGHYITFDQVLDEAVRRAFEEVSRRSPQLAEEEKAKIANFVGIGAVRYALIDVDPGKPVMFTWDRVLNFETNSAPYIQYTHARACSILRKIAKKVQMPNFSLLKENLEHELVLLLANFPDIFIECAEYNKPNMIADYLNTLADKFNTFYNALPVIKAETYDLVEARAYLTEAIRIVLSNALGLIGVVAPEKM